MMATLQLEDGSRRGQEPLRTTSHGFGIDQAMDTGKVVDLADWWKKAGLA